jgi:two-component system, NtrC family, response regulator HydG
MANILIIDDDLFICKTIQKQLQRKGYNSEVAFTGNAGIQRLKKASFDMVLCDYRLPDKDGLEVLQEIKRMDPDVPVVIITAYADVRLAVKLIKQGAADYLTKPLQHEEIVTLVKQLTGKKSGKVSTGDSPKFITGKNPGFIQAVRFAEKVAPTGVSVLVEGETGTGKEYVARYIHQHSQRRDRPFVAVDCGAIPNELAGSELFGHVKGSFTGAVKDKTGVFQQADGGTLFLDEVGNLSYDVQIQLLRALQEKTVTRIGENRPVKVDVRIISATNEPLSVQVEEKRFREDLLHRLNEFRIVLPPLRERPEDLLFFADFFRKNANEELKMKVSGISKETADVFNHYDWPGNIREMRNVVKRAVLLTGSGLLLPASLPREIIQSTIPRSPSGNQKQEESKTFSLKNLTREAEREVIIQAIEEAGYNKSRAARNLQIDRKTLYNKIKQHGIDI